MHLLVCVVNNTAKVNDIVRGFTKIGVTGATVIDSHGTVEIAASEIPVFGGFRQLIRGDRESNRTIFSVISDDLTLDLAMKLVAKTCGDLEEPSTGIMFAVPITHVMGLAPKVE